MQNIKIIVVPIITRTLGIVQKKLTKTLAELEIPRTIELINIIA